MATRKLAIVAATMLAGNAMAAEPEARTVSFVDSKGQAAGSAQLTAMAAGGVLIRLDLVGLPAGQ